MTASETKTQDTTLQRVAVVGGGTIGASWATLFLAKGLSVRLYDPAPDNASVVRQFIAAAWPAMQRLGLHPEADPGRIDFTNNVADAVSDTDFVQESGPENLAIKRELFAELDASTATDTIISSSTSGFMPSDLQHERVAPERYLVGHPFNPPHLVPLVEVVAGAQTSPEVVDKTIRFYDSLGKKTIRIDKEVQGHVANRMQAALYREAIHLVLEGVASPADVDAAVAYGPGLRWAIMGPHTSHQLGGGPGGMRHLLEHIGPNIDRWWQDLGTPSITPDNINKLVAAWDAGNPPSHETLSAERDTLLLALLETLQKTRTELQPEVIEP